MIHRAGEAIVLRSWPFLEADLLVSLFTREQGRIKGVARHAMRSRRRFGGALEPMTYVLASYAERAGQQIGQELMRLDAFEILSSPLSQPVDYARTAALQLIAEVIEEALPERCAGSICGGSRFTTRRRAMG
jgi:DNA repair protein RecO (recombination protein O)